MLKFYIFLYKLTGYCPAWLELRTYKYALRRLNRLSVPGYYVGRPIESIDFWVGYYQTKIGLYRPLGGTKIYWKYFKNYMETKWKTM